MNKPKFEWEVRCIWHFPKVEETMTEIVAKFVTVYDANVCAKALQSLVKNKEYVVVKIGGKKNETK